MKKLVLMMFVGLGLMASNDLMAQRNFTTEYWNPNGQKAECELPIVVTGSPYAYTLVPQPPSGNLMLGSAPSTGLLGMNFFGSPCSGTTVNYSVAGQDETYQMWYSYCCGGEEVDVHIIITTDGTDNHIRVEFVKNGEECEPDGCL